MTAPALERQLDLIRETEYQIMITKSARRKYELHRHLRKLRMEYITAKQYMTEAKNGKRTDTSRTGK